MATVAMHGRSLFAPFYGDDLWFLDHARGHSLPAALAEPSPIGPFFRPWSATIHWWSLARLTGENPFAFHLVNVVLFAAIVALVFLLTRRLIGARGAILAAAFVAIHSAPEAAVRWVSGSQDLWATLAALACILLHSSGRHILAALALLVALFSKETAVVTPLIAVLFDRHQGERAGEALRRAGWLLGALTVWGAAWIPAFSLAAAGNSSYVSVGPASVPAALWHFVCVFCGAEGTPATPFGFPAPGAIALCVVLSALGVVGLLLPAAHSTDSRDGASPSLRTIAIAALLAALPIAAVVPIWSGYQYTFALCIAAIGLGGALARVRTPWLVAAVAVIALGAWRGWGIEEVDPRSDAWKPLSRVNGFYLRRAEAQTAAYLAELKRLRPTLPGRSTVLFGGLPAFIGWQSGNGAVLRWAYADTTLRSRFISEFSAADTMRGPLFFFTAANGRLQEIDGPSRFRHVAGGLLIGDRLDGVAVALALAARESPDDRGVHYLRAWLALENGDSLAAHASLEQANVVPAPGPLPNIDEVKRIAAGGDLRDAVRLLVADLERHELDADGHALLADLLLQHPDGQDGGVIEAFAARALSPRDWTTWKRWGLLQARTSRPRQALQSLEQAQALRAGLPPDPVIERALADLRGVGTR